MVATLSRRGLLLTSSVPMLLCIVGMYVLVGCSPWFLLFEMGFIGTEMTNPSFLFKWSLSDTAFPSSPMS